MISSQQTREAINIYYQGLTTDRTYPFLLDILERRLMHISNHIQVEISNDQVISSYDVEPNAVQLVVIREREERQTLRWRG